MTASQASDNPALARLARLAAYLERDPENLSLRADIFDTALSAGAFDEAQRQVVWALTRNPADFAWRHKLVLLDMARGEWDEARALLGSLEAEGLGGPVVRYNLAYVDFAQGRVADAEAKLGPLVAEAVEQVPESLATLVSCQHLRGAPDEAIATFARHAARVPVSPAALGAASLAAIDADAGASAAAWAEQALRADAHQVEARVAKATLLLGARDAAGALSLLSEVLARKPGDGRVLSTVALAQMLAGQLQAARPLFQRAIEAMPTHIGTWLGYGWCLFFMKDNAGARAAFERALALDENFGESHGAIAVVEAADGHEEAARAAIRRARGLDPRSLAAAYAQGLLDGEAQDTERFIALAQRSLSRHTMPDGRSLSESVLGRR